MFKKPLLRSEAIVLSITPYGERDAIAKIFTKDRGLLPFFFKNAYASKKSTHLESLTHVEIVYQEGGGSFFSAKEITVLNLFLKLRDNYEALMASFDAAKALLVSELPEKSSPDLFDLFSCYLAKMHTVLDPWILAASFRLKILCHEGILTISPYCRDCDEELKKSYLQNGELLCLNCKDSEGAFIFNEEETPLLNTLVNCQSFLEVKQLTLPSHWKQLIPQIFLERINL